MTTENSSKLIRKVGEYGLQESLEIMGELSQESTRKGHLSRQQKKLITLGWCYIKTVNTASISIPVKR